MRSRLSALLLLAALTACAPAQPTGGAAPAAQPAERRSANQVLTIAKAGLPAAVTPEVSSSNNDIYYAVFDTLTTFGKNFEIRPAVATKWEYRPAEKAWRFTLRNDLTFSNGAKLTADDVVYSTNLIIEKTLPTRSFLPALVSVQKVDDTTIDLVTKGDVTMIEGTPWVSVFPAEYHRQAGKDFGIKPIGSGPYQLTDFKTADSIVFKLRDTKHPYRTPIATQLIFKSIPDLGQQVAGLRTGDLDVAQSSFTADQAQQLKAADLVVNTLLTENNFALYSQPEAAARQSPLTDKRVRLALNYAVNRDAIAQAVYKGFAQGTGQLGFPDSAFWNPAVPSFPYDPAMAKKLLADAGYPNGFKLSIGIEATPQTVSPELVTALQSALRDVGIESPAANYELATFLDKYYGRNGQQKGDLFMVSNGNTTPNFTSGRGRFGCDGKGFEIWWCNQQFVAAYDKAIQENDTAKRQDLLKQANDALRDDVPVLYLVARAAFLVNTSKIKGVEFTSRNIYNFDQAYRIE